MDELFFLLYLVLPFKTFLFTFKKGSLIVRGHIYPLFWLIKVIRKSRE